MQFPHICSVGWQLWVSVIESPLVRGMEAVLEVIWLINSTCLPALIVRKFISPNFIYKLKVFSFSGIHSISNFFPFLQKCVSYIWTVSYKIYIRLFHPLALSLKFLLIYPPPPLHFFCPFTMYLLRKPDPYSLSGFPDVEFYCSHLQHIF